MPDNEPDRQEADDRSIDQPDPVEQSHHVEATTGEVIVLTPQVSGEWIAAASDVARRREAMR